jgi:hypothetical protein
MSERTLVWDMRVIFRIYRIDDLGASRTQGGRLPRRCNEHRRVRLPAPPLPSPWDGWPANWAPVETILVDENIGTPSSTGLAVARPGRLAARVRGVTGDVP